MANVLSGATKQFTGNLSDRFDRYMYAGAPIYSVEGAAGSVSTSGLFTASTTPGGPPSHHRCRRQEHHRKHSGDTGRLAHSGHPAAASPAVVTGKITGLSVLANDALGEAALIYTWSAPTAPSAVTFSVNGSNAAKNTVATFTEAGDYDFLVSIADADAHVITSGIAVTVSVTPTQVKVEPQVSMVQVLQTLQLRDGG